MGTGTLPRALPWAGSFRPFRATEPHPQPGRYGRSDPWPPALSRRLKGKRGWSLAQAVSDVVDAAIDLAQPVGARGRGGLHVDGVTLPAQEGLLALPLAEQDVGDGVAGGARLRQFGRAVGEGFAGVPQQLVADVAGELRLLDLARDLRVGFLELRFLTGLDLGEYHDAYWHYLASPSRCATRS